ncbi:hypothetical protein HD597_007812 [Nonomuraea thailandensis]|uniref:DUF4097 domain-containing protein n=1 Tax=Nonomuraea thailandensis TaxID=1188745 RepID=A0A9X2GN28_9ACTN|nr:DUF4097 family beta strand repeat-containing protein [Nonomuraea thailandensis]MCP2360792.1 hypothetical protein [Nonomuraea thailandensis]
MKTIALAAGLLASAALLTGCGLADLAQPGMSESTSYQVTEKVTKLQLKSNSGDAVITETGGTAVRVVETLHWRGEGGKPRPEHKVEGEALLMTYTCPSDWGAGCSVDYKIEIPKGLSVDLDAGSGDLTLRNLTGPIDVNAGSGDVDAAGLGGKQVFADVGSGNIELKYASAPDNADLKAGSGDITLSVPDGAYDVKSEVGSGDAAVTVKKDASSTHKISLTTGSGDITVKPA